MNRRKSWFVAAAVVVAIVTASLVIRNQVKVYRGRQARADEASVRQSQRQSLFDALQPVALTNCQVERFGETHDGGYLMCANLLAGVQAGYSYGIAGYDKWGCDTATKLKVTVHQYDCFNTAQPACPDGSTAFHAECVAGAANTVDGRFFDTIASQFARNGDRAKRIVLKIDVEGAEWEALQSMPDEVLQQIDQMAIEFHWQLDKERWWTYVPQYIAVVERLKQYFHVAHIHFNNASCIPGLEPFPTWAYEVLFVSKRIGVPDPSRRAPVPHPLDAPNNPAFADCQPTSK